MILSDKDILEQVRKGLIVIDPFDEKNVGPSSVDLTLGTTFKVYKAGTIVDPKDVLSLEKNTEEVKIATDDYFLMSPGQFVLAHTNEYIQLDKSLVGFLEGRSTIARMGIIVHAAGLIPPGTGLRKKSRIVLEIFCQNTSPVKLYPGMKIVQIYFSKLLSPAVKGYDERKGSKYVGQETPRIKINDQDFIKMD